MSIWYLKYIIVFKDWRFLLDKMSKFQPVDELSNFYMTVQQLQIGPHLILSQQKSLCHSSGEHLIFPNSGKFACSKMYSKWPML